MEPKPEQLWREREWRMCETSFPYFLRHYWMIFTPSHEEGAVLLDERPEQLESAQLFQTLKRIIVVKARQIGWTTIITCYLFWKCFFTGGRRCAVFSRREEPEANQIIRDMKAGMGLLPNWMLRRGPQVQQSTTSTVRWLNGSSVLSDASADEPARGGTYAVLVYDEFGHFRNQDRAWQSGLAAAEQGQWFVVGNADHWGSRFHAVYTAAKAGENNFRALFYPWNVVKGRTQAWLEQETSTFTPAMKASEYPENDVDCWAQAGAPVFTAAAIEKKLPVTVPFGIYFNREFVDTMNGYLRVWQAPNPDSTYVIGADVAKGLEFGDYSAAVVLDSKYRHVASVRTREVSNIAFGRILNEIGRWYNSALLAVESNTWGTGTIDELAEKLHYPNMYRRRSYNSVFNKITEHWGWYTDDTTKALIIGRLESKMEELDTHDEILMMELLSFRHLAAGRLGGSPHDDMVIACAIATEMVTRTYEPVRDEASEHHRRAELLPPSRFPDFDGTFWHNARVGEEGQDDPSLDDVIIIGGRLT